MGAFFQVGEGMRKTLSFASISLNLATLRNNLECKADMVLKMAEATRIAVALLLGCNSLISSIHFH